MAADWRERAAKPPEPLSEEAERELVAAIERMAHAPRLTGVEAQFGSGEADAVLFEEHRPPRKGKWVIVPSEAQAQHENG